MPARAFPRNLTRAEWKQYIGDALPYQAVCPNLSIDRRLHQRPLHEEKHYATLSSSKHAIDMDPLGGTGTYNPYFPYVAFSSNTPLKSERIGF